MSARRSLIASYPKFGSLVIMAVMATVTIWIAFASLLVSIFPALLPLSFQPSVEDYAWALQLVGSLCLLLGACLYIWAFVLARRRDKSAEDVEKEQLRLKRDELELRRQEVGIEEERHEEEKRHRRVVHPWVSGEKQENQSKKT